MSDNHELHDVVAELPDKFLDCRLGDHRWKRQGEPLEEDQRGLWVIRFRCTGCHAKRHDRITSSGILYARWYDRPDGYDIKGYGHQTRRKDVYRQVLIEKTENGS